MQLTIEALRASVFSSALLDYRQVPVDEWWRRVAGVNAEQVSRNAQSASAVAEGPFDKGRLAVVGLPGRVDWQLLPVAARAPEWPTVGEWPNYIPHFVEPVKAWLREFGVANRVAFGAVVIAIVQTRDEAYHAVEAGLSDLKLKVGSSEVSDFLLQFNKPVPSRHGPQGMVLNRLARWSAAVLKPVTLQLSIGTNPPMIAPMPEASQTELHAARIELDFNTMPDWSGQLASEQAAELFDELVRVAIDYVGERLRS